MTKSSSFVKVRRIRQTALDEQGRFVDIVVGLQGPWPQGHCHTPMGTGISSIPPPFLTPAMLGDYDTPSLSPSLGPEETLVSPLSSLGPGYDSLADFASNVASYPQKEEPATSRDEKTEGPSTRRIRKREQNRESYVSSVPSL